MDEIQPDVMLTEDEMMKALTDTLEKNPCASFVVLYGGICRAQLNKVGIY